MKKTLHILVVLLCAAGCIYPYDPDVDPAPEGVLVVEGDILVGDVSTVLLGMMTSLYSDRAYVNENLGATSVWIEDDAGTVYGAEAEGNHGEHLWTDYWLPVTNQYTFHTEQAPTDRKYRVCVDALGALYTSDWILPPAPPEIRNVRFDADQDEVTVYVSLDGGPESTGYALLSFDETWEFHAEYTLRYEVSPDSWTIEEPILPPDQPNYWCWKHLDSYLLSPVDFTGRTEDGVTDYPLYSFLRTNNRNHRRYRTVVKARTISKETYRYLHNLDEVAGGGSDLFTPNPGEIQGNIRCESDPDRMALGYVTASRVSSRRAFLDNRYYRVTYPNYNALYYIVASDYPGYYEQGFLPLVENPHPDYNPDWEGPYGWGPQRCYDCVADGGTKTIPDENWYKDQ